MRILHLSDLHMGKFLNDYSLLEVQEKLLKDTLTVCANEKIDVILLCGDLYDRAIPAVDCVPVFDKFLSEAVLNMGIKVFAISGNHDSAKRLNFGSSFYKEKGFFLESSFCGNVNKYTLCDEYGEIDFYPVPFIEPIVHKQFFPDKAINNYVQLYNALAEKMLVQIDFNKRNIALFHCFADYFDNEDFDIDSSVGGSEVMNIKPFEKLDYIALGHIHQSYPVGNKEHIRYCGSPLRFNIDDKDVKKYFHIIDIKEKGNISFKKVPIEPLRNVYQVKSEFADIMKGLSSVSKDDYIFFNLLDTMPIFEPMSRIKDIYPNALGLRYVDDNKKEISQIKEELSKKTKEKDIFELFSDFYSDITQTELNDEQKRVVEEAIKTVKGDENASH
jgi:exonuclease SbcD